MLPVNEKFFKFAVQSLLFYTVSSIKYTKDYNNKRSSSHSFYSVKGGLCNLERATPFVINKSLLMQSPVNKNCGSMNNSNCPTTSNGNEKAMNLMLEAFQELNRISDDPFNFIEDRIYQCFKCKSKNDYSEAANKLVFVFVVNLIRMKGGMS